MTFRPLASALILTLVGALVGCNDGIGSPIATPTSATPTALPTGSLTPVASPTTGLFTPIATPSVTPSLGPITARGLVIVRADASDGSGDGLGEPPAFWMEREEAIPSDKALSHADWKLDGPQTASGTTAADGSFAIDTLPPGDYRLTFTKTMDGNLIETTVPLQVGDDGVVDITIELQQGVLRATNRYEDDGVAVVEITGPDGSHVTLRDGQTTVIGDPSRTLTDPEGDGTLQPENCGLNLWRCDDATACEVPGRACQCGSSCPFCEDCGISVCAPRAASQPYRCEADGGCSIPGDRCTCVSSCPDCDDCVVSLCVPACDPVRIVGLSVVGASQVVLGRSSALRALANTDDGGSIDVTYLVNWRSSDVETATVDGWGNVSSHRIGTTAISVTLEDHVSENFPLRVVERPQLERIEVQIGPCYYPWGRPTTGGGFDDALPADVYPHPFCNDVVRVGRSVPLVAWGFYADGQSEEITRAATWAVSPEQVATIVDGQFTGLIGGTATITATHEGVLSAPLTLRVVTEPTVVQLSIYPNNGPTPAVLFPVFADDPRPSDAPVPCFECGYSITVLLGDATHFMATARYDTGEWEDVTASATWRSSAASVAEVNAAGVVTAKAAGQSTIDATFAGADSNPVDVRVVEQATIVDLSIYQDGNDRVVQKMATAHFVANAYYDIGFGRVVTDEAVWRSSDETIGGFDQAGVFSGRQAGQVEVWAELGNRVSNRLPMEVFERSDLSYCDATHINRGEWSDAFNRVTLESDCARYHAPAVVELRFTVDERERPIGVFDPCLDLYVYQGTQKVRTIREEGCGEPFLPQGSPAYDEAAVRYQQKAFWDLKNDRGESVAPGTYTIYGRFYLYYDPVVSISVGVD